MLYYNINHIICVCITYLFSMRKPLLGSLMNINNDNSHPIRMLEVNHSYSPCNRANFHERRCGLERQRNHHHQLEYGAYECEMRGRNKQNSNTMVVLCGLQKEWTGSCGPAHTFGCWHDNVAKVGNFLKTTQGVEFYDTLQISMVK